MAIDARYQDNVVLKQDAFQNLLTNIKNYPIVDIDYVAEDDVDELHGENIWQHYTGGSPCIKITYGDERTTKGNIIFAENLREQMQNYQKLQNQLQTTINQLIQQRNRWEIIYEQNHTIYTEKNNQIERFKINFDQIEYNKIAFLQAGWDLLYLNTPLNINDNYTLVIDNSQGMDSTKIYYTHTNDYLFERYSYKFGNNTPIDVYNNYNNLSQEQKEEILADWSNKVANQQMYVENVTALDRGPVILNELGPEFFEFHNILLTENPFKIISVNDYYDSEKEYFVRNSSDNSFSVYQYNHINSTSSNYETVQADWQQKVSDRIIYVRNGSDQDVTRTFNLMYTSLNSLRANLISMIDRNRQNEALTTAQKEIFEQFRDFIRSYNKLVFLDTIGIAGYTKDEIDLLKFYNPDVTSLVQALDEGDQLGDFNWEQSVLYNTGLDEYYAVFKENIESVVQVIETIINNNLIYIRNEIRNINYQIVERTEEINQYDTSIQELQNQVIDAARNHEGKDHTMYGYKYIKVGSDVNFSKNFDSFTIVNNAVSNQNAGTFRVTTNGKIYEVPIKGFGPNASNKLVTINSPTAGTKIIGNLEATGDIRANKVYNAVFNDYAEYRTTISLTPGHVVIDQDDGSLKCTNTRLLPGAQVISDTFGNSMGKTELATTPIAVAGRVLVYTYQPRENYHAGMAVCSAPNGTIDIMTREEIRDYPDCIVGIVSEIPEYEEWGSDNVKVNGRIWIKVR